MDFKSIAIKFLDRVKALRPLDLVIISIVLIALIVGTLTFVGKRATAESQTVANAKVEIEVLFKGITVRSSNVPFVEGEDTFITIRNVPYTKLKIKTVEYQRKKTIIPTMNPKQQFVVVDDVSAPFQYDFLVSVVDDAKITKDGAVVGGNKIKIGLPVSLEGRAYRFNGVVSNVSVIQEPNTEENSDLTDEVHENNDVQ
ncbi:DUF4330 domain-containing protein [bacterium]|nr:DUF4330 domain-containing protein [bacterium]